MRNWFEDIQKVLRSRYDYADSECANLICHLMEEYAENYSTVQMRKDIEELRDRLNNIKLVEVERQ